MPKILDWKRINPETDLRFESPRPNAGGEGLSARMTCVDPDTNKIEAITIQGPKLRIPFGIDCKMINDTTPRYYCSLAFPTVRFNPSSDEYICDGDKGDVLQFMKFIKNVDKAVNKKAHEQSQEWFKRAISPGVLEELYHKSMVDAKEKEKFSPTFSTKLRHTEHDIKTTFWNEKREQLKLEDIGRGHTVIPLLQTRGVWFAGKTFGCSWQVVQLVVYSKDEFNGCAIDIPGAADENSCDGYGDFSISLPEEDASNNNSSSSASASKRPAEGSDEPAKASGAGAKRAKTG